MTVELTPQQQQAIDATGKSPPRFVDPRSNAAYVLVPEADYESIRALLEEDLQRREIHRTALRNAVGRMEESP